MERFMGIDKEWQQLLAELQNNTRTELILENTKFTLFSLMGLSKALANNYSLKKIALTGTLSFQLTTMEALLKVISAHPTLEVLELPAKLSHHEVKLVCKLFAQHKSLQSIKFPNNLTDEGLKLIANMLTTNTQLVDIIIDYKAVNEVIKVVLTGDGAVGKTPLFERFKGQPFPVGGAPFTIIEEISIRILCSGKGITLNIWDTGGVEQLDRLRSLCYPKTDIHLICFSMVNHDSLENVMDKWIPELRKHRGAVPTLLIGLRSDLVHDPEMLAKLKARGEKPITEEQIKSVMQAGQFEAFFKCSALTGEGVDTVFNKVIEIGWRQREKRDNHPTLQLIEERLVRNRALRPIAEQDLIKANPVIEANPQAKRTQAPEKLIAPEQTSVNLAPQRLQELIDTESLFIASLKECQLFVYHLPYQEIKEQLAPYRLNYASLFTLTNEFGQLGKITEVNFHASLEKLYGILASRAFLTNFAKMIAIAERYYDIVNFIETLEEQYQADPLLPQYQEIFRTLLSYLIRPVQRLARYSLLLEEIQKDYVRFLGKDNGDETLSKILNVRQFYEQVYDMAAKTLTKMLDLSNMSAKSIVIQGFLLELLRACISMQEAKAKKEAATVNLTTLSNNNNNNNHEVLVSEERQVRKKQPAYVQAFQELITTEAHFVQGMRQLETWAKKLSWPLLQQALSPYALNYHTLCKLDNPFAGFTPITTENFRSSLDALRTILLSEPFTQHYAQLMAAAEKYPLTVQTLTELEARYAQDPHIEDYKILFAELLSELIKPMQRLTRYDLLLDEIQKHYQSMLGFGQTDEITHLMKEIRELYNKAYSLSAKSLVNLLEQNDVLHMARQTVVIKSYLAELINTYVEMKIKLEENATHARILPSAALIKSGQAKNSPRNSVILSSNRLSLFVKSPVEKDNATSTTQLEHGEPIIEDKVLKPTNN